MSIFHKWWMVIMMQSKHMVCAHVFASFVFCGSISPPNIWNQHVCGIRPEFGGLKTPFKDLYYIRKIQVYWHVGSQLVLHLWQVVQPPEQSRNIPPPFQVYAFSPIFCGFFSDSSKVLQTFINSLVGQNDFFQEIPQRQRFPKKGEGEIVKSTDLDETVAPRKWFERNQ